MATSSAKTKTKASGAQPAATTSAEEQRAKVAKELLNAKQENISSAFLHAMYEASHFIITRYPYLCAVLLMVSTAELVKLKILTTTIFPYIYFSVGMYFIIGTCISYDIFRSKQLFSAIMVMMTFGISFYEYKLFNDNEQIMFRIIIRNIATIGCYMSVAGGITKNEKHRFYNKYALMFGRQLLGISSMLKAMHLWNSNEEFEAHSNFLPGGDVTTFVILVGFLCCCVCLYGDMNVTYAAKLLCVLLLVVMTIVDFQTKYWIDHHKNFKKWMIINIACKNVPVISTLLLYRKGYW